ncbi:auxin-responsive protein SAUR76-like [Phragmites australis]|uniref:auxin-responsive protein SAUR76-like n=1 Tax=Phragmites australis TaxID=29695 RepID=UPI002D765348|nr:auxin-responsive protein SAUR76-like [Phragmites australis]
MNRVRNVLLRKCKSLSRAGRPSSASYSNLRSMSTREAAADTGVEAPVGSGGAVVFVGSSRRRYVISAERLSHPLIAALIDPGAGGDDDSGRDGRKPIAVNCEVVLFDHLLWMLDNAADLRAGGGDDDDAMRELAQLYAC